MENRPVNLANTLIPNTGARFTMLGLRSVETLRLNLSFAVAHSKRL